MGVIKVWVLGSWAGFVFKGSGLEFLFQGLALDRKCSFLLNPKKSYINTGIYV